MKPRHLVNLIRLLGSVTLAILLVWLCWQSKVFFSQQNEELRVPLEQTPLFVTKVPEALALETLLELGEGKPSTTLRGSWSQFRGDDRSGIAKNSEPLSLDSPRTIWEIPVGEGYASPAVRNGIAYLIDHDVTQARDVVRALSMDDGRDIWRFSWPVSILSDHGITRTVPAVTDKYCVGIGPKCHLFCVDAKTGEKKWLLDMVAQYGTKVPNWYAGQCALIVNESDGRETAIIAPSGPAALLVALDCETGEERWRTINPFQWNMTHVSVVQMELDGKATYIYCGSDGVLGIDALDGRILWGTTAWKIVQAACPSPVVIPANRIFFSGGYGAGALLLEVYRTQQGQYRTKVLKRLKESEFGSTQQTPLWYKNHLWGVGRSTRKFCCLDADANVVWRSRTKTDFGDGPYMIADDKIFSLNDDGLLVMAAATPEKWTPLVETEIIHGHECWGPLALVEGRLLLRSINKLICVDIRENKDIKED